LAIILLEHYSNEYEIYQDINKRPNTIMIAPNVPQLTFEKKCSIEAAEHAPRDIIN